MNEIPTYPDEHLPDQSSDIEAVRAAWRGCREECGELLLAALEGKRNERELREAIREAVALLKAAPLRTDVEDLASSKARNAYREAIRAWLALPAVQSALALEAADKGE